MLCYAQLTSGKSRREKLCLETVEPFGVVMAVCVATLLLALFALLALLA